jgi:hypothetical protein
MTSATHSRFCLTGSSVANNTGNSTGGLGHTRDAQGQQQTHD